MSLRTRIIAALALPLACLAGNTASAQAKPDQQLPAAFRPSEPYALKWPLIHEQDIEWKKRVWRIIDLKNPENSLLESAALGTPLAGLLLDGVRSGVLKAYSAADDRFTTALTLEAVRTMQLDPSRVTAFKLKEDWIFLKKEQRLVVRIVGIAPLIAPEEGGKDQLSPAFWLYYPDIRPLAQQASLQHAEKGAETLDQVLEGRRFHSRVVTVSTPLAIPSLQAGH